MMENFGTQVIYVRGNHDDFLDNLAPLNFYNIQILRTASTKVTVDVIM